MKKLLNSWHGFALMAILSVLFACNEKVNPDDTIKLEDGSDYTKDNVGKFKAAGRVAVNETITLKGPNGLFVSSEDGTEPMRCNRAVADDWEKFTIVDAGNGKVALRSMGKYVSSENGTQPITCNRTTIGDWERFTLVNNADNTVSFRGNNNRYISSENGTMAMTCNRTVADGWEKFSTGTTTTPPPTGGTWRRANLTNFESYPDPNSEECIKYNGCMWAGQFAFVSGKQPESWVMANNIAAVHSRDANTYRLKTLRLRQGTRQIDVKVYDMCADSDCGGCCTQNADAGGIGFLIDIEKYTMQRFGSGSGVVEWMCLDCQ